MHSRSRRTPGRRAAAVRPAISGRNLARSLRLVLSPKRNCCLVGCEGRREGEGGREGGRRGRPRGGGPRGGGNYERPACKPPRLGLTGLDCGLFFFFLETHTRTYTRTHTHTEFPPISLLPSLCGCSFRCWPCSRQKVRGGPLPGQPRERKQEGGPCSWPKIRPQPRPEWPGPRPSGWAPGPCVGTQASCPAPAPPPGSLQTPSQHPRPSQRQAKAGEGAVGWTWGPGSIQARVWRGHGAVGRMSGKVRLCCCCPVASGCREGL